MTKAAWPVGWMALLGAFAGLVNRGVIDSLAGRPIDDVQALFDAAVFAILFAGVAALRNRMTKRHPPGTF